MVQVGRHKVTGWDGMGGDYHLFVTASSRFFFCPRRRPSGRSLESTARVYYSGLVFRAISSDLASLSSTFDDPNDISAIRD